jgi:aminoglycoside phosphotransferase (APT) family kinase protein
VDVAEATRAFEAVTGEPPASVRPIEGGWASFTFEVDGRYIARFPRNASIARSTRAELDLLPRLGPIVDFAVPTVRWQGTRDGFPFFVYESIPGRAVTPRDLDAHPGLVHELASALRQLHGANPSIVPRDPATDPMGAWRASYAELRAAAQRRVAPLLDAAVAEHLATAWDDFEASLSFTPALVHADLGLEHVLVEHGHVTGIIDWEDAGLGDPAIDFVGFHIGLGAERTERIMNAYDAGDPALRQRIPHYVWIGAIHAVLYGLDEARPEIVRHGVQGLGERLRSLR